MLLYCYKTALLLWRYCTVSISLQYCSCNSTAIFATVVFSDAVIACYAHYLQWLCNAHTMRTQILRKHRHKLKAGGCVHSFDGTLSEAQALIAEGLHIGIYINVHTVKLTILYIVYECAESAHRYICTCTVLTNSLYIVYECAEGLHIGIYVHVLTKLTIHSACILYYIISSLR
jgi:hypothetical protein